MTKAKHNCPQAVFIVLVDTVLNALLYFTLKGFVQTFEIEA